MNCWTCKQPIVPSDAPQESGYGYIHDDGTWFCPWSVSPFSLAKPSQYGG